MKLTEHERFTKTNIVKIACACLLIGLAAMASSAQTLTVLAKFKGTPSGRPFPNGGLVQGLDGNLYGTTSGGGTYGFGSVFKVTPSGRVTTLYSFCPAGGNCVDGSYPWSLVLGTDGNFYGATYGGSPNGFTGGTIFKVTSKGKLTTLYTFSTTNGGPDGVAPNGPLVQGWDGSFYGTTSSGGYSNLGTIFKITPGGTFTVLYRFVCSSTACPDGAFPSPLVQGPDGNFYGTTPGETFSSGPGAGSVFQVTPAGTLTTLYSFCSLAYCDDGSYPGASYNGSYTGLFAGLDGNLYGTTQAGGAGDSVGGDLCGQQGCGTVFQITTSGSFTSLHSFCEQRSKFPCSDGYGPESPPVQGTDGNLYGTTTLTTGITGPDNGKIYQVTPAGVFTTIYTFCLVKGCPDGNVPQPMMQATDGNFYGTTLTGGTGNNGTFFRLSMGLAPFVRTVPAAAKVTNAVKILGNNLTGATSVTFNGVPAAFTVVSPTQIKTTVPAGASSGPVQVVTPSGTLSGNMSFEVLQ